MNIFIGHNDITFDETINNSIYIECDHEGILKGFVKDGIKGISTTHLDSKIHFISSSRMSMNKEFVEMGLNYNHFDSSTITHAVGTGVMDSPIQKIIERRKFILSNSGKVNEHHKTWGRMNESRRAQQLREIPYDVVFLVDFSEIEEYYREDIGELLILGKELGLVIIAYSKESLSQRFKDKAFSKTIKAKFTYSLEEIN